MHVHVEVTAEDIERGVRKDCARCPIARALVRAMPAHSVEVESEIVMAWATEPPLVETATLPHAAAAFVNAFDHDRTVEPLSFDLEFEPEEEGW